MEKVSLNRLETEITEGDIARARQEAPNSRQTIDSG
jgi:hypothetical protein